MKKKLRTSTNLRCRELALAFRAQRALATFAVRRGLSMRAGGGEDVGVNVLGGSENAENILRSHWVLLWEVLFQLYCIERLIWIWSGHTPKRKTVCKKRRPDRPGLIRSDKKIRSKKRNQNLDPPELRERLLPPRGGAGAPGGGSVWDLIMTILMTMLLIRKLLMTMLMMMMIMKLLMVTD